MPDVASVSDWARKSVAGDIDISNKTFYSNELLKDYVEAHAGRDDENVIVSRKRVASLEEQIADPKEQVEGMVARDDRSEWLRAENASLHVEIAQGDGRICSLEADLGRTRVQLTKLREGGGDNVTRIDEMRHS